MKLTLKQLIGNHKISDFGPTVPDNLNTLLDRSNKLLLPYGKDISITSCLRTVEEHRKIYKAKGIDSPPLGSAHLRGCALDIYDPTKDLQQFILENEDLVIKIGLWFENFDYTPTWVHAQINPPASGSRFFRP